MLKNNRRITFEKTHEKDEQGASPAFSQIWSVISVVNLALIWYTENDRRDGGMETNDSKMLTSGMVDILGDKLDAVILYGAYSS